MSSFNIGVITDGFKTDPLTALKKAAALGVFGIQVYTFRGPMLPENLTAEFRRNYKKLADDLGLQITATCGEFSHAFRNDVLNQKMIDDMKSQMELAVEFGAPIVTGHIGTIPEDTGSKCYRLMLEGCAQVADFAAKAGVTFAVETGPERSIVLKTFLETKKCIKRIFYLKHNLVKMVCCVTIIKEYGLIISKDSTTTRTIKISKV